MISPPPNPLAKATTPMSLDQKIAVSDAEVEAAARCYAGINYPIDDAERVAKDWVLKIEIRMVLEAAAKVRAAEGRS